MSPIGSDTKISKENFDYENFNINPKKKQFHLNIHESLSLPRPIKSTKYVTKENSPEKSPKN